MYARGQPAGMWWVRGRVVEGERRGGPVGAGAVMSSAALAHSRTRTPEHQQEGECEKPGSSHGSIMWRVKQMGYSSPRRHG